MSVRRAVYPGTFDPITLGHVDVVQRGLKLFDEIVVAVAESSRKNPMFDLAARLQMVNETFAGDTAIRVVSFDGLLVNLVEQQQACAVLRGLRAASDFEYEFQLAAMNRKLNSEIESVFVMAREEYTFVSSSFIREISTMGGDVNALVPQAVQAHLPTSKVD